MGPGLSLVLLCDSVWTLCLGSQCSALVCAIAVYEFMWLLRAR